MGHGFNSLCIVPSVSVTFHETDTQLLHFRPCGHRIGGSHDNGKKRVLVFHLQHVPFISKYEASVRENQEEAQVVTMSVTDGDEPHSPAWNAKFKIVSGDSRGLFSVRTGRNKHEGIITTAKVRSEPRIFCPTLNLSVLYLFLLIKSSAGRVTFKMKSNLSECMKNCLKMEEL